MKKFAAMFVSILFVLSCLPVVHASAEPTMLAETSSCNTDSSVNSGETVGFIDWKDSHYVVLENNILYLGDCNSNEEPIAIIDGIGCLQKVKNDEFIAWGMSPCNILEPTLIPDWLSVGLMAGDITVEFSALDKLVYINGIEVAYYQTTPSIYSYVWNSENHLVFNCCQSDWTWIENVPVNWEKLEFDPASILDNTELFASIPLATTQICIDCEDPEYQKILDRVVEETAQ